jgi:type VI secretion system secreted protein Hcp
MAGLAMWVFALPASAEHIFCSVIGAKQGTFQTDRGVNGDAKQIPVLSLMQEVTVPFDPASGQVSGRRRHSPIAIVKLLDASSPQFFEAVITNEILRSVTCTLYRGSNAGAARAYFKIILTNAIIIDVKNTGNGVNGDARDDEHERVEMTFQKIELTDLDAGTVAIDDWLSAL